MTSIPRRRQRGWYAISAAWFRWLHIYISMLGFSALMFFAVTGITLNHPTWLGGSRQAMKDAEGTLPSSLFEQTEDGIPLVNQLQVAELLRERHRLRGSVSEFEVDEYECLVVFKGPGYSTDIFIDHQTGSYQLTETTTSLVAVLNDLHKGRDSGTGWAWVIDVSAVVMILISLSGFGLIFYLRKRRTPGVLTAVVGTILLILAWATLVP